MARKVDLVIGVDASFEVESQMEVQQGGRRTGAGGGALPEDRIIDGVSLLDHFTSAGAHKLNRDELIWHFPHYRHDPGPYSIIRQGDYKLIKYWEGFDELYDLKNDLGETTDLAASMPEKVAELEARLMSALRSMNAKLPRPNPDYSNEE